MNERCAACGMAVADGEYHPHAACVMYGAARDAEMVRANLTAVAEEGARAQREADAARVKAAGCRCRSLKGAIWELPSGAGISSPGLSGDRPVKVHNPACPIALASAILEGK